MLSEFHQRYVPATAVAAGWSGSRDTCVPGSIALAFQQASLDRINTYRWLAGLPAVTSFSDARPAQSQAAALITSANHIATHQPPSGWRCWSPSAASGAAGANLALGYDGLSAIDAYMDDAGAGNAGVGHRRWLLYPSQQRVAIGYVSGDAMHFAAQATWVLGPFGDYPPITPGIAWPPAGFVPTPLLPRLSGRWSFSYPAADFSAASVAMWRDGVALSAPLLEPVETGLGENTLVWRPVGVIEAPDGRDVVYRVQVDGVRGIGIPSRFEYDVVTVDPWAPPPVPDRVFEDGFDPGAISAR